MFSARSVHIGHDISPVDVDVARSLLRSMRALQATESAARRERRRRHTIVDVDLQCTCTCVLLASTVRWQPVSHCAARLRAGWGESLRIRQVLSYSLPLRLLQRRTGWSDGQADTTGQGRAAHQFNQTRLILAGSLLTQPGRL